MTRLPALIVLVLTAAAPGACTVDHSALRAPSTSGVEASGLSPSAQRGAIFAQVRCSSCHGVTKSARSPNPESPRFEAIANSPGLSRGTLRTFLRDSHNYPGAMNFTIAPGESDDLADYMLTLKSRDYRPDI
jgi:mono/diheme cytochrome c family protein